MIDIDFCCDDTDCDDDICVIDICDVCVTLLETDIDSDDLCADMNDGGPGIEPGLGEAGAT